MVTDAQRSTVRFPGFPVRLCVDASARLVPRSVAQLVEHRSPKPGVAGSIPAGPVRELKSMTELRLFLSHLECKDFPPVAHIQHPRDAIELELGLLLLQPHAPHHAAIIFVNSEEHRALVPGAVLFLRHAVYVVSRLLARRVALPDLGERETRIVNRCAAWVVGIQDAPRDVRRDGQHTHSRERYLAERAPPWCRMVRVVA